MCPENILPASTAAPGIQAQQREASIVLEAEGQCRLTPLSCLHQLAKHMRADSLNEKIAHRPAPEEVIEKHILHDDPRSSEEKYAEAIEDEYAKREGGA